MSCNSSSRSFMVCTTFFCILPTAIGIISSNGVELRRKIWKHKYLSGCAMFALSIEQLFYKINMVFFTKTVKGGVFMGLRFRKSLKVGPARMTFSKSGVSHSIGGKGFRVTRTPKGGIRTTASIPGTGLSYTTESKSQKKSHTGQRNTNRSGQKTTAVSRKTNPSKPPRSPKVYFSCGVILAVIGLLVLFAFWPLGLLFAGIGIYYIACGPKIYAKLAANYKTVHPEFKEKL